MGSNVGFRENVKCNRNLPSRSPIDFNRSSQSMILSLDPRPHIDYPTVDPLVNRNDYAGKLCKRGTK